MRKRTPSYAELEQRLAAIDKSFLEILDRRSLGVLVEIDGVVVHANRTVLALLGASSTSEVLGRAMERWVPGRRSASAGQSEAPSGESDSPNAADVGVLRRLDGTCVNVLSMSTRFSWAGAPATYMTFEEATPENCLKEALGESDALLRCVLEASPALILLVDLEGRITFLSSRRPGVGPELGSILWDWVVREDRSHTREVVQRVLAGGEAVRLEWRCEGPDGKPVSFDVYVGPLRDGGEFAAATVLVSNNEERRQAETERRLWRTAIEQVACAIMVCDLDANITYVNPSFTRITGYECAEVVGRNPRFLKSGEQDEQAYTELWSTLLAGGVWSGRLHNRRKDGSLYAEDATISPVLDDSGSRIGYVAAKRDVTETLRLEDELRQSQRMDAIGQLAGGVAHDFNNQLTVIGLCSSVLLDREDLDAQARQNVREIALAADLAASTTRQLLTFSRRQSVNPEALDMNEVVGRSAKMIRRLIGEDIEFVTSFEDGLGACWADAAQIQQAVLNLALNARDAMLRGGRLLLQTAKVEIESGFACEHPGLEPGPHVLVTVSDDGTGIAPQLQKRIFDPFFTTKEVGKGTGLGLATVHGIVRQCQGLILLDSELGVGTTFRLYFPRMACEVPVASAPTVAGELSGDESILVLEDEEQVRILTVRMLERFGYTVQAAVSVREALELCRAGSSFDLLLSDVVMPCESGPVAAERIRDLLPGIAVLFMSGYADEALTPYSTSQQSAPLLEKPFGPDALAKAVRDVLDGAKA